VLLVEEIGGYYCIAGLAEADPTSRLECPMQNAKCPMLKIVLNLGIEHPEL
jgi:hypothetical protein